MIKRIIFDLDYTLLKPNYDKEHNFLRRYVSKDNEYFIYHMYEILKEYETTYPKYELELFLKHMNKYSNGVKIEKDFFDSWVLFSTELDEQDTKEVEDVLSYLDKKYELIVLTNWITEAQKKKLEKFGLLKYFSEVFGGDMCLKPFPESYQLAIGKHKPEECVMIGDNLNMDVIGPINCGLSAIHYTNGKEVNHEYQKVKCLSELKKIL